MLNWSNSFSICAFLDSNEYQAKHGKFRCIAGIGSRAEITGSDAGDFSVLRSGYYEDWMFGHFAFELGTLATAKADPIGFPLLRFFVPQVLLLLHDDAVEIGVHDDVNADDIFAEINAFVAVPSSDKLRHEFKAKFTREEYLSVISKLQQHILRGDCYEINFCQEFFSLNSFIQPVQVFSELLRVSPNPFAAFYKMNDRYLLCASPERYVQIAGRRIISQPIKGTLQRMPDIDDEVSRRALYESSKDRSENVMVVDMVRNDLSRICVPGSVKVDELFGIYDFPQLYQMISTISGHLAEGVTWVDAIEATFPMGSMTGAPKHSVLELISRYERSARGLFSGAVGYVTPSGDADFNVVIRSLQYNAASGYLSYQVGSGITHYSDPAAEYEECLVKAAAIKKVLGLPAPSIDV